MQRQLDLKFLGIYTSRKSGKDICRYEVSGNAEVLAAWHQANAQWIPKDEKGKPLNILLSMTYVKGNQGKLVEAQNGNWYVDTTAQKLRKKELEAAGFSEAAVAIAMATIGTKIATQPTDEQEEEDQPAPVTQPARKTR